MTSATRLAYPSDRGLWSARSGDHRRAITLLLNTSSSWGLRRATLVTFEHFEQMGILFYNSINLEF